MAGCGGGGEKPTDTGKAGGELRVQLGEPRHLVSTNTGESEGGAVARTIYSGLVDYDSKTLKPFNVVAESIKSTDQKTWTIKLKDGWKFHNGEAVDSDSFIRAWNFGAYAPNAQTGSHFFDRIAGYKDLQSKDPDGDGPQKAPDPQAKEMSGLKKVDARTFEVTLTDQFSSFPTMLGYTAFMPMAKACVEDVKKCDEQPIGNGPYKMDAPWEHKKQIRLVRNDDYAGQKAKLDRLTFTIYDKIDTAYNDFLAGQIDLMRSLPPAKVKEARQKYKDTLIEDESASFTYLGFPLYTPGLQDKRIRQAISMSIDRKAIIDAVFDGRFVPAKGFAPSMIPGAKPGACKYCEVDVDQAKKLLAEAGGWKGGKLQLWFNAGAGHETWVQAVGDQIKKNLGIDYELKGNLQFAQYLETADAKKFTGPFRLGWSPDYPLVENYLKPLYGTDGSSNNSGYANTDFDGLISKGDGSKNLDSAIPLYSQAEAIVGEDIPVVPLWFGKASVTYSPKFTGFEVNPIHGVGGVDYTKISLK
jgi:peptide/nickel transport system substrate-binding protein